MKDEMVEIVETYNQEGYLVKKTANGIPVFIPEQITPTVKITDLDTEGVSQKTLLTKQQFKERYKHTYIN